MQGNPERPYAQLLTPAAKSQKLLLRLQHKKLLTPTEMSRWQAVFAVWQKLLQKNIPSTPWPGFADLLLFPEEWYIALLLHPFDQVSTVKAAAGWRHLDGYLLVDHRPEAAMLLAVDAHLVISLQLVDRIGSRTWQAVSQEIAPWQAELVNGLCVRDQDAALDLMGLVRQQKSEPWGGLNLPEGLAGAVQAVYFALWRARGAVVSRDRLDVLPGQVTAALDWMMAAALVEEAGGLFRLR